MLSLVVMSNYGITFVASVLISIALSVSVSKAEEEVSPTVPQTQATELGQPVENQGNPPEWLQVPLSLTDCLNIALENNSDIKKSKFDVEKSIGLSISNKAIVIPKVTGSIGVTRRDSDYYSGALRDTGISEILPEKYRDLEVDSLNDAWSSSIRITQTIFKGGQIAASLGIAKHVKTQALSAHQTVIANTLTDVRTKYYDVLLAMAEIEVKEASVKLLEQELSDSEKRFRAGTVPKFNVLRAETKLANAKPPLIKAHNDYRLAKNDLCNLLGYNVPRSVWEDIPLQVKGELEAPPFEVNLTLAMAQAVESRPELLTLRETQQIARQSVRMARGSYYPSVNAFAGYDAQNNPLVTDLTKTFNGWVVGGQLNWNIFDGLYTKGQVDIAKAELAKTEEDIASTIRSIELEVRSCYSSFIQAKETLESQIKNVELAEEALRLANSRAEANTGTQLDVLDAETTLTQARTTKVEALHYYEVSLARLERAIGINISQDNITQ